MTYYYLLAEKPSQAKAYADAYNVKEKHKTHIDLKPCDTFPKGATITWGIGHLVELQMPQDYKDEWKSWNLANLPMIPDEHKYKVKQSTKGQFNFIKKIAKECKDNNGIFVNCCDIDREGSLIFNTIIAMTGVNNLKTKRLWINSLENEAIRDGFNNLLDNEKDLLMFEEAQTRQIADWLVGMNMSQLYTLLLQKQGLKGQTLSVGRVQSVLVYLIYERQIEIDNFVSKPFYELISNFSHEKGDYQGKAKLKESDKQVVNDLLEKNNLSDMSSDEAIIKNVTKNKKQTKSPLLHSLSTLQTTANKNWKYSPSKVLEVMQSLYEKKIVSYPRTDCNFITDSEHEYLLNNIEKYQSLLNVDFEVNTEKNSRYVNSKKVEEHYAIIPTKTIPSEETINKLTTEEKNIFFEVLKTTLAMFHRDYEFEETVIVTDVNNIEFFTKGKIELDKGWKELFNKEEVNEKEKEKALPNVEKDENVIAKLEIKEGYTTPPKPYTEGGLINLMKTAGKMVEDEEEVEILKEVEGIGTEATRSGIIDTVKRNNYIEIKKNNVHPTSKAELLCESIKGSLLSSPSMTAKWESYLTKIGNGKGSQETFLKNIEKFLRTTIDEAEKQVATLKDKIDKENEQYKVGTCPSCKGSIEDKGKFYGCSNFPECKFILSKEFRKKKLTKKNIEELLTKKETVVTNLKSKKGSKYNAKVGLNDKNYIEFLEFAKK